MNYRPSNWHEPSVGFDFEGLDVSEVPGVDEQFWGAQAELLADLLRWATVPHSLAHVGARVVVLVLYLNPRLINKSSLAEISRMRGAPSRAALSKALLEFQRRYELKTSYFQKPSWACERFRRSAIAAHLNQQSPPSQDAP
jgi:hypothetical protein